MNSKFALAPLGIAGILSFALLAGCSDKKTETTAPLNVFVTDVSKQASTQSRNFTATVHARVESDVSFRTGGKVVRRLVDVGDAIKAGQVIAVLDNVDYDLAVAAAEDQVRQAKAQAALDSADQARFGRLKTDGSMAAADHERQTFRSQASDAKLDQAQRQLQVSKNLASYATLVAPFDGVVTGLHVEVGQVVAQGQPVVSIARNGERELVADVPEGLIADIKSLRAQASQWGGKGDVVALKLREVSPLASPQGRMFRVKYVQSQTGTSGVNAWPLGGTSELSLSYPAMSSVVLPVSALVNAGPSPTVWAIDASGDKLKPISVRVVSTTSDTVSVEGVPEHARVVTVGAQKLDPGIKVRPIERKLDETLKVARSAT